MTLQLLFWTCCVLVAYTYAVYPLVLALWSAMKRIPSRANASAPPPPVSLVISVFNEERVLRAKLDNCRLIDYPHDRFEILIGSDGSNDGTDEILRHCDNPLVRFLPFAQRRGKAAVLNELIGKAKGEIILLSDANTLFTAETVNNLVAPFADPSIGAVCGELVLQSDTNSAGSFGEASYWSFENGIKANESRIHSTLGATGAVYAIRKGLFIPIPTEKVVADDFLIPMYILKQGYRNYYEPRAIAYERSSNSIGGEFRRKVRISAGNFNGLKEFFPLLHPKYGFVSFALWSHKIIRWAVPGLLLIILGLNIALESTSALYRVLLLLQGALYLLSIVGLVMDALKIRAGVLSYPYYFVAMNAALFVGFVKYLLGLQRPTWEVVR